MLEPQFQPGSAFTEGLQGDHEIIPPIELQRKLFPFIESQFPGDRGRVAWVENIMLDRDVYHGRSIGVKIDRAFQGAGYSIKGDENNSEVIKRRHLILLAHLRKVILQDAVAIMAVEDPTCNCSDHYIFQLPVFKSPAFYRFKFQLLKQMAIATSPLTDSLSANASGIYREYQEFKARATQILTDMDRIVQTLIGIGKEQTKPSKGEGEHISMEAPPAIVTPPLESPSSMSSQQQHSQSQSQVVHEEPDHPGSNSDSGPDTSTDPEAEESKVISGRMAKMHQLVNKERREAGKEITKPLDMPQYKMLSRHKALEHVWQEWFRGVDGGLSIMELDLWFETRWRRWRNREESNANAVLYLFKKHIVFSVLRAFPPGQDLPDQETAALAVVKANIAKAGSINLYHKTLPKGEPKKYKRQKKD